MDRPVYSKMEVEEGTGNTPFNFKILFLSPHTCTDCLKTSSTKLNREDCKCSSFPEIESSMVGTHHNQQSTDIN